MHHPPTFLTIKGQTILFLTFCMLLVNVTYGLRSSNTQLCISCPRGPWLQLVHSPQGDEIAIEMCPKTSVAMFIIQLYDSMIVKHDPKQYIALHDACCIIISYHLDIVYTNLWCTLLCFQHLNDM